MEFIKTVSADAEITDQLFYNLGANISNLLFTLLIVGIIVSVYFIFRGE